MSKRINIVLPETTVQTIDRMAKPGQRSRFIDAAVRHYVANRSTEALRARLEHAAVRDQDLEHEVAAEWLAVDKESWKLPDGNRTRSATQGAVKSILLRSTRR
jgi:CopG family transcriptional regulator / antitoxin EndoAI